MKKPIISLIIVIATLSHIGIVVTQLYWVRKAIDLKEEQFTNSVRLALKSVSNHLVNFYCFPTGSPEDEHTFNCKVEDIDPAFLRKAIWEEFGCMKINEEFDYGIIDTQQKVLLDGSFEHYPSELPQVLHAIPLTGFEHSDRHMLVVYFPKQTSMIMKQMVVWLGLSALFIIVLILSFYFTIIFFLRQKKLSEMKSDFVNNMTHEFKTPISTISLASEMLMNKKIQQDPEKAARYAKVIYDENARLQSQVEEVLRIALLDKGEIKIKNKEVDVHKLITKTVHSFNLTVKQRNGMIQTIFYARKFILSVDRDHVRNVLSNLIDNAIKYSPEAPEISITTRNNNTGIIISVEDKGIGISHKNQKDIFKKLYRVPTGNIHNEKGFGLGLYYVKSIVEMHGGNVKLSSEPGKGSRFDVFLPF